MGGRQGGGEGRWGEGRWGDLKNQGLGFAPGRKKPCIARVTPASFASFRDEKEQKLRSSLYTIHRISRNFSRMIPDSFCPCQIPEPTLRVQWLPNILSRHLQLAQDLGVTKRRPFALVAFVASKRSFRHPQEERIVRLP